MTGLPSSVRERDVICRRGGALRRVARSRLARRMAAFGLAACDSKAEVK